MLRISGLSYRYRGQWLGRAKTALQALSLHVSAGEAFGFLGSNGAGKTTTIKCILGLIKPTAGSILINGRNSQDPASRACVGYLAEQPYFYDQLTVSETVAMFAELAGVSRRDAATKTTKALDLLGISDRRASRLRTLSKGLIQRVGMAQAIVAQPALLILDEPFSGLDPIGRKHFRDLMIQLRRDGTTLFISSHVLGDVERICDRASIMVQGEIKGVFDLRKLPALDSAQYELEVSGTLAETDHISKKAASTLEEGSVSRFSFKQREHAEFALKVALNHGLEVVSYGIQKGSLEDLFASIIQKNSTHSPDLFSTTETLT
jgi:ABC-2 type transport system ATP-binding protein